MSSTSSLFDALFQHAPISMAFVDENYVLRRVNSRSCQLWGYAQDALESNSLSRLIHPDDWAVFQQYREFKPELNIPAPEPEIRLIRKNGELLWVRANFSLIPDTTVAHPSGLLSLTDISELKAIQEIHRDSEARYQRVMEAASIGVYDWDLQTNQSYWNDTNYKLLNIPKEAGRPNFQAVLAQLPEQEQAAAQQKMQAAIERGEMYENEYPILQADGTYRYILSRGKVTKWDATGKAKVVSGMLTDITALKLAQEQAKQAESRFNKVVEANLIGVILIQKDGLIREANKAFLDMLGFSRAELEAGLLNWRELTPPDYQYVNERNERIINRTGVMPISEKQYFHKDGHRVDVILAVAMFEDDPNSGVGFIVDNTARKRQERALRESEDNWRIMANLIPQIVWMADTTGQRYWFNQRWYDFTGTTLEQVHGWGWCQFLHPDHVSRIRASIQQAWTNEEPWEDSYLIRNKDGHYHWFLARALPVRNEEGHIIRWFGTSTDITEIHDIQEALRQSQRELTASNRDLEQFASIASHDLQAPLRKAKTFCDMISDQARGKLDENTLDLIDRTRNALTQMQNLVADLLTLSSISQETRDFEMVDLNVPLKQALFNLSDVIQTKDARIEAGSLETIHGNTQLLTQLLQNLIENALKYQKPGQQPVISIRSSCQNQQCQIVVSDNGIGFPQQEAERIFRPFERLHGKSSPYTGTGIGLAICQRIVERHHGAIAAYSEVGQGATFSVTLPLHAKPSLGASCRNPAVQFSRK